MELTFNEVSEKLRKGKEKSPTVKYLIFFLFAGHGVKRNGMQEMAYNEFDKKTCFYRMFKAEAKLRMYAEIYPNSYIIGIFAC